MDFTVSFSPEIEAFRKEVSDWLDANAPPWVYSSDPNDYGPEHWANRSALRRKLGEKGWLYATGNPKYGGGGLTVEHAVVISQELQKRNINIQSGGPAEMTVIGGMQVYGTEEQKNHWIPQFMKGEVEAWQLLTEPQGGSDLASARTTAILDGDDYVLNGQKIFVGEEYVPKYGVAIVNSDPTGPRHRNLTYLIVPLDAPGLTIQPLYLLSGSGADTPSKHKNIVFFDDVRVPVFNRIGGHNQGWEVASINMEIEHGGGGNISEDRNFHRLIQVLRELTWEGKPLIEDPEIRDLLGELIVQRETLRLFGLRNYWMAQTKQRMGHEGPQLSYLGKKYSHPLALKMQQLLGHYALTRDPKYMVAKGFLELWQRSCFVNVHWGGGFNIQATIIARRLGIGRNTREEGARFE